MIVITLTIRQSFWLCYGRVPQKNLGNILVFFYAFFLPPLLFINEWNKFYTWSHLKIYLFSALIMASMSGVVRPWVSHFVKGGGECLGWWTSVVVNVWGCKCLGWWTSNFTQGVMNVWGGENLRWWTSDFTKGAVNVWVVNVLQLVNRLLMQVRRGWPRGWRGLGSAAWQWHQVALTIFISSHQP